MKERKDKGEQGQREEKEMEGRKEFGKECRGKRRYEEGGGWRSRRGEKKEKEGKEEELQREEKEMEGKKGRIRKGG